MPRSRTLTRRQWLAMSGGACLTGLATAQSHEHEGHHAGNPYAMLSKGACERSGLSCAASATPWFSSDGTLWLCWAGEGAVWLAHSSDGGVRFSDPVELARHDAYLDIGPDARPQIVCNDKGHFLIAYGYFYDDHWNARINLITSVDGGQTFSAPQALTPDALSQRFPALTVDAQGRFLVAWVDKRWVMQDAKNGIKREGASIAYAWSDDGGLTFPKQSLAWARTCECCRIALTMSPQNLPVLMYRALFDGDVRDHAIQRFMSDDQLEPPHRVAVDQWVTHACPHHGPALAISGAGTLHAAWFTQGSVRTGVFYANSRDDGLHYSEPLRLGSANRLVGRPNVVSVGKKVWLVWKEFDGHQSSIGLRFSKDDGRHWSEPSVVVSATGYSDHPLLINHGKDVFLSWLTREQGYHLLALREA